MKYIHITNKILFAISIILGIAMQSSMAQTKTDSHIHGHVLDANTGEHLPYVNIYIKGTNIGTVTNESGHYHIENLPIGTHTVVASCMGYKTVEKTATIKSHKTNVQLHFEIEENAMVIKDVVVSANRCEVDRKEAPLL